MSPSEAPAATDRAARVAALVAEAADLTRDMAEDGEALPLATLQSLVSLGVRLYAASVAGTGSGDVPTDGSISTTDAIVTAVALLRAQNLNAFDTALWFSHTADRG